GWGSVASGDRATATGWSTTASGSQSSTMGRSTIASGDQALAMGWGSVASGDQSTAMGKSSIAAGYSSTAMGLNTKSMAFGNLAIGRYNIGNGNNTTWLSDDPLFEVGNGIDDSNRNNAFTVFKNGNTEIDGDLDITGAISKSSGTFKIDHPLDPENKYLYHSFVESPDMMNVYNGNVITGVDGSAMVEMPEYFEALNKDFRYQLTVIGDFAQAIISKEISNNNFEIRTDKPNIKVSWQVTGIRKDAYAEKNRIQVEVDKEKENRGSYLHPEAYGKDEALKEGYHEGMLK
ncbi:MAG: hypothetical protein HKN68_07215, partial [Saprospiraceae bacterium]|nr:hypothetical protein [Saprospiraceae bacterium]